MESGVGQEVLMGGHYVARAHKLAGFHLEEEEPAENRLEEGLL